MMLWLNVILLLLYSSLIYSLIRGGVTAMIVVAVKVGLIFFPVSFRIRTRSGLIIFCLLSVGL